MNYHYTVQTEKSFADAVNAVTSETAKMGYRVLHVHDVRETLEFKGFKIGNLKIIEVCNAKHASELLQKELKMSLFMPCRISVYDREGKTYISSMNTETISEMVPGLDFRDLAAQVNKQLETIVDNAR